jgi:hypothetical protein
MGTTFHVPGGRAIKVVPMKSILEAAYRLRSELELADDE